MTNSLKLIIFIVYIIPFFAFSQSISQKLRSTESLKSGDIIRGRILLSPRPGLPERALAKMLEPHKGRTRKIGQSNIFIVEVPRYTEERVVAALSKNPHLKFVELDRSVAPSLVPNDPYYSNQWHLPKIGAPSAWDISQGSDTVIAILDSGINSQHPDFAGKVVAGWNFYDNNSDTTDLTGHGTHCAGVASGSSNNGIGVAGVAGQSKLMPIRITEPTAGGASYGNMAKGLIYAADHGARIASVSFQNVMGSSATLEAALYMRNKNGLVTVSAGNSSSQENFTETPNMIQVSATDKNDFKAYFSSYGAYVDIAAPGLDIWTTDKNGGYSSVQGTSFSTPLVAGVISLMMAANPQLSQYDIENILYSTALDLGSAGKDFYFGNGLVKADASVQTALLAIPTVDSENPIVSIVNPIAGATVAGLVPVDIQATDNRGVTIVQLKINNTVIASDSSAPYALTWDTQNVPNGKATLVAQAFDAAGNYSFSAAVEVNVNNQVQPPPPTTDTQAPTLKIINPVAGSVSGTITISVEASDNYGTHDITQFLYIDDVLMTSGTGGSLSYNWNTRVKKVSKGTHTIRAVAKDAAGNTSSTSVIVNVIR